MSRGLDQRAECVVPREKGLMPRSKGAVSSGQVIGYIAMGEARGGGGGEFDFHFPPTHTHTLEQIVWLELRK